MNKKEEIMNYLHTNVFDPILNSETASNSLKQGIRLTIMRMNKLDAKGIVQYYWSAIVGTDRSIEFASHMRQEGYTRFEEIIEEFREKFNDKWLKA